MKKLKSVGQYFVALTLAVVVFCGSVTTAHAADGYSLINPTPSSLAYAAWNSWTEKMGYFILDVDPRFNNIYYSVLVSYETLSNIVSDAHMSTLNVSLYYNSYIDRYVAYVNDSSAFAFASTYGALGTRDGYVLTAEPPIDLGDTNSILERIRLFTTNIFDQVSAFRQKFIEYTNVAVQEYNYINTALHAIVGQLENLIASGSSTSAIISKIEEVVVAIENSSDVSLDFTNINVKLDELFASLEVTIKGAADHSRIISQLGYIVGQLQYGGASPSGVWQPTTIYDYIQGIYQKMGSGGGGGDTVSDGSLIYNAIKDFQVDFDNTFSDLQQIYPTEKVEQISSGSFEWNNGIDILNSVTASDKLATTTIYRLPETTMNVTENCGTFRIDNDGNPLPVSVNLSYDNASHNLSTYAINETKTVTGTDIIITDAYPTTPISLKLYGHSQQNGTPTPSNPVPIYGGLENGNPYVYMYKGSDDSYKHTIDASFVNVNTPLHGIPTTQAGNYVDENGQHWICDVVDFNAGTYTKNVASVTFDGSSDEYWYSNQYANYCYYIKFLPDSAVVDLSAGMSNSFVFYPVHGANGSIFSQQNGTVGYSIAGYDVGYHGLFLSFGHSNYTIAELRAWLAENPVTIYYACQPEVYEAFEVYGNGTLDSSYTRINMGDFVNLPISVTYTIGNPYTALYSDVDGNWYKQRNDGSSTKITDSRVDTLNAAFNYKQYDNAADIKFNAGTNIIQVSNGDLTVDYIKGSKFFNWLYLYLSNFDGGSMDTDALLDKLDDIEDALSNMGGDINIENNLDFDISNDNDSYNVFYVTDPDTGEDTSIVDLSGDALTAFGRFLNFLYQIGFGDALENFSGTVDDLTDFYMGAGNGGVDVWAS